MLVMDQLRRGDHRLRWLALAVCAALGVLLAGLWYLQVVQADHYRERMRNQTFRTVRVPAVRGKMLDRHGQVLADNRPSYQLNLYIEELRPQFVAEYWRLRAILVAERLAQRSAASPAKPAGVLDGLLDRFRSRRPTIRPGRDDIQQLNTRARYHVVSNTVARVAALLGTPLEIQQKDYVRHHYQWPYRPLPILENLTPFQVARFLEQAPVLPGVDLEVQPIRHYPHGRQVAHVLGYLTRDDLARGDEEEGFSYSLPSYQGAVGLEAGYDEALVGRPGIESIVVNSLSYRESETIWTPAEAGMNLTLTLDLELQLAAVRALQSAGPETRGAVVVLDATNGDVLALVSAPSYDPNAFLQGISQADWTNYLNHPTLRPMLNRATQGAYPPGSIFKMVTGLACLEAGLDPAATYEVQPNPRLPGRGAYFVGRRLIRDTAPPGDYNFRRALLRSSNAYFIHHGLQTGRDALLEVGKRFFLGERIGLPLRQEARGFFPYPREVRWQWTEGNVANVCIGQEITVTPLQMAVLTAAVANGGRVYWPRLVLRLDPPEPGVQGLPIVFEPRVRGELGVRPENLAILREAMLADTEEPEGTGYRAFRDRDRKTPALRHLRVGGKTGTAEIEQNGRVVEYITWFTSFAPYEDPRYVVVVMVEGGGSGGGTCAPIARQVYQAIESRAAPGAAGRPATLASVAPP